MTNVTLESLAAALKGDEARVWQSAYGHEPSLRDVVSLFAHHRWVPLWRNEKGEEQGGWRCDGHLREGQTRCDCGLDDLLSVLDAALPSPAPEPPPEKLRQRVHSNIQDATADKDERAVQPAPDLPDVEILARAIDAWWSPISEHLSEPGTYTVELDPPKVAETLVAEYNRFLSKSEARESGGEP